MCFLILHFATEIFTFSSQCKLLHAYFWTQHVRINVHRVGLYLCITLLQSMWPFWDLSGLMTKKYWGHLKVWSLLKYLDKYPLMLVYFHSFSISSCLLSILKCVIYGINVNATIKDWRTFLCGFLGVFTVIMLSISVVFLSKRLAKLPFCLPYNGSYESRWLGEVSCTFNIP